MRKFLSRFFQILLILVIGISSSYAQSKSIKGKVVDATGELLPGVSVIVKGTTVGTTTNLDGAFTLSVPENAKTLVFSFIGMKEKEVNIVGKTEINVQLEESNINLDELVVVGYGTQKKANLTGAVAAVKSERLENRAISSTAQGLQGLVPNLNISFESGEPGNSKANFNIRGNTSINGGSPLILVDGVEQDLELINPEDIESVSVLKDASSAAIYGARAAFGVILVTTKKAEKGKPTRIDYSGSYTVKKPTVMPKLVDNSYDWALWVNKAMNNFDGSQAINEQDMAKIKAYYEDPANNPEWEILDGSFKFYGHYNWKDELIRDFAPTQNHNVKITGGSAKTSYYTSVGYYSQEGLYRKGTDTYERFNIRMNVYSEFKDWMDIKFKVSYNNKKTDKPHVYKSDKAVVNSILYSRPNTPKIFPGDDPLYKGRYFSSPAAYQELAGRDTYQNNDIWLTTGVDIKLHKNLSVISDFSYNIYNSHSEKDATKINFLTRKLEDDYDITGDDYIYLRSDWKHYYSFNAYAQYDNIFADDHHFKATVGFNQEWKKGKYHSSNRKELITDELPAINLALGDQEVNGREYHWAVRGAFYRLNYSYKDKYLVEFNGRYDGTSRFPKDDRFGFFPSVSGAWRLTQEDFMQNVTFLDNLKLRASYGSLGNQNVNSYYPYIPDMSSGQTSNFLFGHKKQLYINAPALVSPSLTWEKATTVDYGIDITMLKSRFDLTFDIYTRKTSDMLMAVKYPELLGSSAPKSNAADLKTRGWEVAVTWRDRIGRDFKYDIGLSLSDYQAEITKYDNPTGSLSEYYEGKKLGEIWGYETAGIYQSEQEVSNGPDQSDIAINWKPGDIHYKDQLTEDTDGDGIADAGDKVINKGDYTLENHGDLKVIGNTTPRYSFGANINCDYKGFFVNMFFQGIGKRDFWPSDNTFWPFANQWSQVQTHFITQSWTEDNRDAYFGRPLARDKRNREVQSRYIQDASYIRLKNLTIGYNLPKSVINKMGIRKAKIYVSGANLWEHSNIGKPFDPEAIKTGSGLLYPFQRSYTLGLNVSF
ncbi:TonB-dependent receptor [Puteibacter caeruleilacunae]|nr:TonB-dependent receptor [Puteibacter caeruleilacunae]